MKTKKEKKLNLIPSKKSFEPTQNYEKENKIEPLKLMCVIVTRDQAEYFIKGFNKLGISVCFEAYGIGTAPKEFSNFIGSYETKKAWIIAPVKVSELENVKEFIERRFSVSKRAKGIAFSLPIDSMIGVVLYKFLTNKREEA